MAKSTFIPPGSDQPIDVRLEHRPGDDADAYILLVGENQSELDIARAGAGEGVIRVHGKVHRYYSFRRESSVHVWLDGHVYSLQLVESSARRAAGDALKAGPGGNAITAPMPGTILKLLVAAGDSVAAHQPIVVMESMKMEMTLSAPGAGRVKDVLCAAGELVEVGKVLVKLEPPENG